MQATRKPCRKCPQPQSAFQPPSELIAAVEAQQFVAQMQPLVNDVGFKISAGSMSVVTAFMVMARRCLHIGQQFEPCSVCRKDLVMFQELIQFGINAKETRTTYFASSKWRALKLFAGFEINILRACFKWIPELKFLMLFGVLGLASIVFWSWGWLP
jgi:hypothetical protein